MRGWFAAVLHEEMLKDSRIWCLTGDLGYGALDLIRDDFPDRFVNVGAAENLLVGAGVGLALKGKVPFLYSITPFLLYRPFEWLRNYLHHEKIPVRLVGSGVDDDYKLDGISHHCFEAKQVLSCVPNIACYWPEHKESIPEMVHSMIQFSEPSFIALRR
jgi:transketolase